MEEDRESYEISSNILLYDTKCPKLIQQTYVLKQQAATMLWVVCTLLNMRNFDVGHVSKLCKFMILEFGQ